MGAVRLQVEVPGTDAVADPASSEGLRLSLWYKPVSAAILEEGPSTCRCAAVNRSHLPEIRGVQEAPWLPPQPAYCCRYVTQCSHGSSAGAAANERYIFKCPYGRAFGESAQDTSARQH